MYLHRSRPLAPVRVPRRECYRCFKPQVACVCASIAPVANRTGLLILQHPHERFHPLGTVRIARLGFTRVDVVLSARWDERTRPVRLPERSALLFPSSRARDLVEIPTEDRPRHLVVLDGTWSHAHKMYANHRWLHHMPHVRLTPVQPSLYAGTRTQPRAGCIATLEAIVHALQIIEPQTPGLDGLLRTFAAMVERQGAYTRKRS